MKFRKKKGDWIIRGVNGEFYSCKPDIFVATYMSQPMSSPDRSTPLTLEEWLKEIIDCPRCLPVVRDDGLTPPICDAHVAELRALVARAVLEAAEEGFRAGWDAGNVEGWESSRRCITNNAADADWLASDIRARLLKDQP